jgi:hypothetical protein
MLILVAVHTLAERQRFLEIAAVVAPQAVNVLMLAH